MIIEILFVKNFQRAFCHRFERCVKYSQHLRVPELVEGLLFSL